MIYRNETPRQGKYKGIKLDTKQKAIKFVNWQYNSGLITKGELENALNTIAFEFSF